MAQIISENTIKVLNRLQGAESVKMNSESLVFLRVNPKMHFLPPHYHIELGFCHLTKQT